MAKHKQLSRIPQVASTQVLAPILGVHMVEVVSTRPDVINGTFRGKINSIMILLAELYAI